MARAEGDPGGDRGPILSVRGLTVELQTRRGTGLGVDQVDLEIYPGETLGLVGESGSGKTLAAMSIIGLHPRPAARITAGSVRYMGVDLAQLPEDELRKFRGGEIALIPQDPMTSLNPVLTVRRQMFETLRLHTGMKGQALHRRAVDLLDELQIQSPADRLKAYPHQLSGGMRQRVVGAIALAGDPRLIIADEPTTSLDATVQAAYLDLLQKLQEESGVAILFITHDFGVVAGFCDRVAVMYAGRVVETAPTAEIFTNPHHPYTQALIASVPDFDRIGERLLGIEGQPPTVFDKLPGCPFTPRCPHAMAQCASEVPPVYEVASDHSCACWLYP